MVRRHAGMACFQEIHLLRPVHEADVLDLVDELTGIVRQAVRHGIAPELLGMFELLEDLDDLGDIDRAVRLALRRVAQLADAGVPGAGVVPAVRAFLRQFIRHLINLDLQPGFQALEHRSQVGGHDAAPDHNDIRIINVRRVFQSKGRVGHEESQKGFGMLPEIHRAPIGALRVSFALGFL